MPAYDHQTIEKKWQDAWEAANAFATPAVEVGDPEKRYVLNMFPYPSGSGLHVGHLLGYTGTDIVARTSRMQGKKVLHPMGWDAFGLPAENFAIKSGVHPAISTEKNTAEYKRQFRQAGISHDWSREINTSDPGYYKWTQWLFTVLYERGLAYRKEGMVNWCPKDQTVLANEQAQGGVCDRCGSPVVQKNLKQWYFKITDYADRLLDGLEGLDWPDKIKTMQRNWIGKSEGAQLFFEVDGGHKVEVFTTRPDTVFGATYLVLAPEHVLVASIATPQQLAEVMAYQEAAARKNELERTFLDKEKSGVFTGAYAVNPATQERIPVWIADYVISTYGTGAIMAVPAHDERDYAFAMAFNLPVRQVIEGDTLPILQKGTLINSGGFSGRQSLEAWGAILEAVGGTKKTTYRLRDWLVSRQRFWGAPIPVVVDAEGNERTLSVEELPVKLPLDVEFRPTGQSPLVTETAWRDYVDKDGKHWTREPETLDTFVCSSWYFLRYPTPNLETVAFDKEELKKWLPVDIYSGGAEHAVLHLLYARFFTKVLFDAGYLDFDEPFLSLHNQGMILGPDHQKMSKSKGNVISPDDMVRDFGADSMRTYEMFMAPFDTERPWNTKGVVGVRRFLDKVWRLQEKLTDAAPADGELRTINKVIRKVSEDIAGYRFNTAVSSMMEAVNQLSEQESLARTTYGRLLLILNPFAPHITEELWHMLGHEGFCSLAAWPSVDEKYLVSETVEYPVQVNGKLRFKVVLPAGASEEEVLAAVRAHERYADAIGENAIKKEIVVPGRLVSLVV